MYEETSPSGTGCLTNDSLAGSTKSEEDGKKTHRRPPDLRLRTRSAARLPPPGLCVAPFRAMSPSCRIPHDIISTSCRPRDPCAETRTACYAVEMFALAHSPGGCSSSSSYTTSGSSAGTHSCDEQTRGSDGGVESAVDDFAPGGHTGELVPEGHVFGAVTCRHEER